jgi:NAD(P)-dependent dehydrogenase (short-subunit alcohol dehydrogenase family)
VRAESWTVDLRRQDAIDEFFTVFGGAGHTPRIWVSNAGIAPRRPALSISAADWDDVLDLNLRAAYLAASRAAQMMIEALWPGVIVNMSSSTAHRADANPLHYRVCKTGLVAMTQSLAVELGRHGIRVVAVAPTLVNTPPLQEALKRPAPTRSANWALRRSPNGCRCAAWPNPPTSPTASSSSSAIWPP